MIGDINSINPIITICFLVCYGMINLCSFSLEMLSQPSWRPTWKFYHPLLSLLGFLACLFLMIAISWWSFLIVIFVIVLLFTIVYYNKKDNSHYGDIVDAVRLS